MSSPLPFSAVVGQGPAQEALLLAAVEPRLGGVLLRGDKGAAKTTLARGLAALLPGSAPFVELPLGATEDRVVGSIDAAHLLTSGEVRVRPGLLAAADGGVLHVDEVNLLADHVVDVLLDVATSGVVRVERDGVARRQPARFVLVASMNPEEGELRPQLLDRFGLAVDVAAPTDVATRAEAVTRQLAAERGDALAAHHAADAEAARRLAAARPAAVAPGLVAHACRVAREVGVEGLRADLMLVRAAAARAGWEGRAEATVADLRAVAPWVLGHRRRPRPDAGPPDRALDDALDRALDQALDAAGDEASDDDALDPAGGERAPAPADDGHRSWGTGADGPVAPVAPPDGVRPRPAVPAGRRGRSDDRRGRFVRARRVEGPGGGDVAVDDLAVAATAHQVAARRAAGSVGVGPGDLRVAVRASGAARLVVLAVDTSGSMGADRRLAATRAAVLGLLTDAHQQRDRVALVAFRGEGAEVVLRPTGSVEVARARLADLPVGGATPLAAGLDAVHDLARASASAPVVVVVTDGRATAGGPDPVAAARAAAVRLARLGAPALVVDAEESRPRLGLAVELATTLGARHVRLADLATPADLADPIRALAPVRPTGSDPVGR